LSIKGRVKRKNIHFEPGPASRIQAPPAFPLSRGFVEDFIFLWRPVGFHETHHWLIFLNQFEVFEAGSGPAAFDFFI
jgi:hypothetical protein